MRTAKRTTVSAPRDENQTASVEQVLDAFRHFRAAVADLFHAVGVDPTKTRETARALKLNRGLAWRLTRVVCAPESPDVISGVPGRASLTRFTHACRTSGAPERSILAAVTAFDAYESAVVSSSGDRKTLSMLMSGRGAAPAGEQERARRKLFDGACAVWGAQAQIRFVTVFVFPSPTNDRKLDAGHVTGYVGFRRLSGRAWPLSYEAVHDVEGHVREFEKLPLDPSGSSEGQLQLIKDFCDPPSPKIEVTRIGDYKRFELAAGPVGNEGLTTCVFGSHLCRLYPRYSATPDTAGFMVLLHTPVERVLFDMFVHRDLGVSEAPRTELLDRLTFPHDPVESEFARQRLPLSVEPTPLQGGIPGAIYPHLPWYPRLLQFVTQRIEHDIDQFVGSRFEMLYPPISTTLSRRFDLRPG